MRRIRITLTALAAIAVVTVVAGQAAEGHGTSGHADHGEGSVATTTFTGEIIDITCYLRHESKGPKHVKCVIFCASKSMPFGFLEAETGRVYLLLPDGHTEPTKDLQQHFGQQVEVTGILTEGNGLKGLQIETVKSL
jgi:hypothetical protein